MTIYQVTHRHYYGDRPDQCIDHTLGYYSTIEKARDAIKEFLGGVIACDDSFGFEVWTSSYLPRTEYIIDTIEVY